MRDGAWDVGQRWNLLDAPEGFNHPGVGISASVICSVCAVGWLGGLVFAPMGAPCCSGGGAVEGGSPCGWLFIISLSMTLLSSHMWT